MAFEQELRILSEMLPEEYRSKLIEQLKRHINQSSLCGAIQDCISDIEKLIIYNKGLPGSDARERIHEYNKEIRIFNQLEDDLIKRKRSIDDDFEVSCDQ